jgi:hypothetical protein
MNQPGVYFTLDAPFVSIIGLYSNTSDKGYGIISSPDPVSATSVVGQAQKKFLIRELQRIAGDRKAGKSKALLLAVHHPAYKGTNTAVKPLTADIDDACQQAGLWPDLVLSGHEHSYSRYLRTMPNGMQIPYIIAGSGGYNLTSSAPASDSKQKIPAAVAKGDPNYKAYVNDFGYLKITVNSAQISVVFNCTNPTYGPAWDSIVVDLKTHKVTDGK